MARYRRRDQVEATVLDELVVDGTRYGVDLIGKRATGVEGYRMTLAFLADAGEQSAFVELEPAATRAEVRRRAEELAKDRERLVRLLREEKGGGG